MQISIYVVSVKTFYDRHRHIEQLADRFGFNFDYIFDYDAGEDWKNIAWCQVAPNLSQKSASNVLKHMEAQRLFLETDSDVALVLEDDVVLFEDFFGRLSKVLERAASLDPGWLIFLGGADNKIDSRYLEGENFDLVLSPLTTAEAYLTDKVGSAKRVEWLTTNALDRQADHQLKLIDEAVNLSQYRVCAPMATQGSITGMFATALDSSRGKHGPTFLRFRYEYNRLRRQIIPRLWHKFSQL